VRRQSGSLFIPLPAGTIITSNKGKRSWTLAKPSESVIGPDNVESSRFEFEGDAEKPFVLSRERSSSEIYLALVPVDKFKATRVRGEVLPVLVEPLVFLPVDFSSPKTGSSHRSAVKLLWESAPVSVRRDLVAEENVRSALIGAPHAESGILLWLLGCSGLESCLPRMGILCPNGSAGAVMCRRASQDAKGERELHCILVPTPGAANTSRVRLCLRYTLGNATFQELGEEYRELNDAPQDGSGTFSCNVNSPFLAFAGIPAQFKASRVIFAFPADRNGKGEGRFKQTEAIAGNGWRMLKEKEIVQDLLLQAVWSSLPLRTRKALGKFMKLGVNVKDVADQTGRAFSAALRNDKERLGEFYHRLFEEALQRWNGCSVFSRLSDALTSGAQAGDGIGSLRGLLIRSFRNFVLSLSRLIPNDPTTPCAAGDESVCYKQLAKLVEETVPVFMEV